MKMYKRPEKELDPDKYPGQIINRPPAHLSGTLEKEIEEFKLQEGFYCVGGFSEEACQCGPIGFCPYKDCKLVL